MADEIDSEGGPIHPPHPKRRIMNIADQKAATSLLLDAHHRAGHIEPVDDENGQPAYRVTAAGIEWALRTIEQLATPTEETP